MNKQEIQFRDAQTKQMVKQANSRLELLEIDVKEVELKARRQRAITQLKQDFITEVRIDPEYQELLAIEHEKFLKQRDEELARMQAEQETEAPVQGEGIPGFEIVSN